MLINFYSSVFCKPSILFNDFEQRLLDMRVQCGLAVKLISEYLLKQTGEKQRIVLMVDESVESGNVYDMLKKIGTLLDIQFASFPNLKSLDFVFTTLSVSLVQNYKTGSGRSVSVIPLPLLHNAKTLFSSGHAVRETSRKLQCLLAFAGGHPRTLEYVKDLESSIPLENLSVLMNSLTCKVLDKYPRHNFSSKFVIPALLGDPVKLCEFPNGSEKSFDTLVMEGVYSNSCDNQEWFTPTMPLIYIRCFAKDNASSSSEIGWVWHLYKLITLCDDPESFCGIKNDSFHYHWVTMCL